METWQQKAADLRTEINKILADAGITFSAQHVPTEYDPKLKPGDDDAWGKKNCIAWQVTFARGGVKWETSYSQGIGHLPKTVYAQKMGGGISMDEAEAIRQTLATGKIFPVGSQWAGKPLPPPDAADVIGCLISDAEAADCGTFEEWADNTGYDKDSRKAEKIFNACLEAARQLNRVMGAAVIEKLRPLTAEL